MNQEIYVTVKLYLEDKLPESERQTFEARYEEDKEFAKEVDEYSLMQSVIQEYGDQQLNEELTQLGKSLMAGQSEEKEEAKVVSFASRFKANRNMWFAAAAVILLLIIIVPNLPGPSYTSDQLYAENFSTPEIQVVRGGDEDEVWAKVVKAYEDENYEEVSGLIESGLKDTVFSRPSEAYYYLGLSLMAQEKLELARDAFDQISQSSLNYLKAKWFRALIHLEAKDLEKSKALLEEVIEDGEDPEIVQSAKDLLEKFDKIDP